MRVCVVTSLEAVQEPRAPRHAVWLARAGKGVAVSFVDSAPFGAPRRPVRVLEGVSNLEWRTHHYATRTAGMLRLAWDRARQKALRAGFSALRQVSAGAISTRAFGLRRLLVEIGADVYLAHNAETLLPAFQAARQRRALLMFDSMEFHSDMGDGQTALEKRMIHAMERAVLPQCALVLASSAQVAQALAHEYGIPAPLPLDNVPELERELPPKPETGLALYWRNSVIGLGQRGLDDALQALAQLPADVTLHLQGRMPADGGAELKRRIAELGLGSRIVFHPPYAPEHAVREAARHHVGLCLERRGCRNHDLTVSNKIFDYHMAGMAVVASDLPGLRGVIERSQGGVLFQPGSVSDLRTRITTLHGDRGLREKLAGHARGFALRAGNREVERQKFVHAFAETCRKAPRAGMGMIQPLLRKSVSLVPWKWRGAIKRLPVVAAFQRWLLARFLEGREFVHAVDAGPARGLKYPITLPADKGIWTGTYEQELAEAVARAVRPADVCFDIGGWHGFFGGVMALAGASRVCIFEPMPENVAQLRKLIALNPDLPMTLIEAAVAEAEGEIEFTIMPESSMGKLAVSSFQAEIQGGKRIAVRAVALDALIASGEVPPPAVMKIDVEGAELLVLRGARQLLAAHAPKLFMEIHSAELAKACREFLEALDYEVKVVAQTGSEVCHFHAASRRLASPGGSSQ